ncbi:AEC family transporter [Sulfuritalea hydrogenivorans]|uniref:Auxin efflux carrier n=1 Tax=Sulfuritalea hydrogenivorans sk43H TaxID=1223802 RepID=W0SB10_9PROT|nr:AEC family transporter [Sulfuritalea hydrogenivorans]BAO28389.1 auxin efflux carrier [Sulfuritalea hydrogenivorans sk43H]
MIERIAGIVFPIYAIVAVGYGYGRWKKPDMAFANQLNMDIFVPALVFAALASKSFDIAQNIPLLLGGTVVVLGTGLLAWPVARLLGVAGNTFVPPMMFKNSGNMGLPLMVLAFGESALPAAVVLFFAENFLHYSLGTWLLDHRAKLWNLWRVPVIAAALAGLAVSTLHFPLWQPLWLSVKLLGDVSIPLLLFSLGVRLTDSRHADLHISLAGAITSPVAGVLVALLMNLLLGLTGRDAAMLILFGALPPAVLNYIFAERYRQEPERVASMVLVGNMASLAIIPLTLAWVLR